MRLDVSYYFWPPSCVVNDVPGLFTGSAMPMRFADLDVFAHRRLRSNDQMTDESGQSYPFTINTLLDRAIGNRAVLRRFTVNAHTDNAASAVPTPC
jgi:hypothetical protein